MCAQSNHLALVNAVLIIMLMEIKHGSLSFARNVPIHNIRSFFPVLVERLVTEREANTTLRPDYQKKICSAW